MRLPYPASAVLLLCLLLGLAAIWAGPHPPMVDLPQHAGQLRLLHDALAGTGRWTDAVEFNLWTPYLLAFGLALPLTAWLSVGVALQVLLSLSFLAFVAAGIGLRRQFGAPAALDALVAVGFFGFAYKWGFLTFLVAAPLGLVFIAAAAAHARLPTPRRAVGLALLGVLLLNSHGLVFLFALACGALMAALQAPSFSELRRRALPYLLLTLVLVAYTVLRARAESHFGLPATVPAVDWHQGLRHELLAYPFGTYWTPAVGVACGVLAVAFAAGGWRLATGRDALGWVPLAVVLLILLAVPSFAMETTFLYQRFALFLLPALVWALRDTEPPAAGASGRRLVARWAVGATCVAMLSLNLASATRFATESRDFDRLAAQLQPGQRALALVFDAGTAADPTPRYKPYLHFASWYQAEHGGWVDMNFAVAPPQLLRLRPDRPSPVALNFAAMPDRFDWREHRGELFRYFLVRGGPDTGLLPLAGNPCPLQRVAVAGRWAAYEAGACRDRTGLPPAAG